MTTFDSYTDDAFGNKR